MDWLQDLRLSNSCCLIGLPLLFQAWECTPEKAVAWNVLSLFTTSGMLFLEVSLVAFLLQGNYASGLEALTRTFVVSGLIIGLDLLLKVFCAFLKHFHPFLGCWKIKLGESFQKLGF